MQGGLKGIADSVGLIVGALTDLRELWDSIPEGLRDILFIGGIVDKTKELAKNATGDFGGDAARERAATAKGQAQDSQGVAGRGGYGTTNVYVQAAPGENAERGVARALRADRALRGLTPHG